MDIDLKAEVRLADFHYMCLPVLNPELEDKELIDVPFFHWELYQDLNKESRLHLMVAPVGFAKSTVLRIWGLFQFLNKKDYYILYVSSSYSKAVDQFSGVVKILEQRFLQVIYGYSITNKNESEIVITFKDGKRSKFEAIASGSDILGINFEGIRPSLILVDDLEELEQAKNRDRTDKLQEWLLQTLVSRLPSIQDGRLRMINTVLTSDSLTNRILGKSPVVEHNNFGDWTHSFYQALKNNKSIWESRHPTKNLLREQELRPHIFASNYMNEPLDSMDSLIKLEDIKYYSLIDLDKIPVVYVHADTTHTAKDTSDYFCLTVLGENMQDHNYYLVDFVLDKLDVESQALALIDMYIRFKEKVKKITYDEKANQGFGFWVKKLAKDRFGISLPLEEIKYGGDKVAHFLPHQPHFKANRIYLPSNHKSTNLAVGQLLAFPAKSVNDDFVDGLSGVLDNYLIPTKKQTDSMGYSIEYTTRSML